MPNVLLTDVDIQNFSYEASEYPKLIGKKFQVILIPSEPIHLPYVAMSEGDGIRNNAIYIRRGTNTEEANYDELQRVINRRLETAYFSQSELDARAHIEQLKNAI